MNKNLLKYILRGIIAFGTVNLLNGVSIKIAEKNTPVTKPVTKTVHKPLVNGLNNIAVASSLPLPVSLPVFLPETLPSLCSQPIGKEQPAGPATTEPELMEQEISQVPTNRLVIAPQNLSEKHEKDYVLPRVYRQNSQRAQQEKTEKKQVAAEAREIGENDCYAASDYSGACDGSSSRSHRSSPTSQSAAEEAMLNQLIQGMLAQENSGSNPYGSGMAQSEAPRNYANSTDCSAKPTGGQKNSAQKDKEPGTQTSTTTTPKTENTVTESFPDEENSELIAKAIKKLKKKNKKNLEKAEASNPEIKVAAAQNTTPTTAPQNKPDASAVQPGVPDELLEYFNKFGELMENSDKITPDAEKIITTLQEKSAAWVAAAKKNIADEKIQKSLKGYQIFIEQQCARCDQIIADIKAQKEGTAEEKSATCQLFAQIKSIYKNILKTFETTQQPIAQPDQEQPKPVENPGTTPNTNKGMIENVCEKIENGANQLAKHINEHPILSGIAAASSFAAIWAAKYFRKNTDSAKK